MSTPTSPLENALVLALEALERVLRPDFPELTLASAEVVEATGPHHTFLLSGPFATNGGTLAIGVEGDASISGAIESGAKALKAALAEDMTAALGQDVAIYGKGEVAEDTATLGPAVKVTVEGIDTPTTLWVSVASALGDIMGPLVAERLDELESGPDAETKTEPEAEVEPEPEPEADTTSEPEDSAAEDVAPETAEPLEAEHVDQPQVIDQTLPEPTPAAEPIAQPDITPAAQPRAHQPRAAEPVEVLTAEFPQMGGSSSLGR